MHTSAPSILPRPPIKVLHLTIEMAPGGRRDAIATLAQHSASCGVSSHLATLTGTGEELRTWRDAFQSATILGKSGRSNIGRLPELKRACSGSGIDLVHAHDAKSRLLHHSYALSQIRHTWFTPFIARWTSIPLAGGIG